ncbi:MAG TPA: hypothetical protein VJU61_05165 [Polyangiaceae bacterium]|nr:hypothetical protein [Polyangiaceae bacterium]
MSGGWSARRLGPSGRGWLRALSCGVLLSSCGDSPGSRWNGVQTCSMAVPPEEDPEPRVIPPVELVLSSSELVVTADGYLINRFSLGPIGGFRCVASQATIIRFTSQGGAYPKPVALDEFDCFSDDGLVYTLGGQGMADDRSLFFTVTVRALLDHDYYASLSCTNQFVRYDLGSTPDGGAVPVFPDPLPTPDAGAPEEGDIIPFE